MKNLIQNSLLFAMFMLTNIALAQGPDPDNLPGDSNPTDAPINQYLLTLMFMALLFVYQFRFKKTSKNK
jgi:hypothetical protein